MTSSSSCRTFPNQKWAGTRRASTNGTTGRSGCLSMILTCPIPKVGKAATYASQTRCGVRFLLSCNSAGYATELKHILGLGWGNAMQELLLNAHLAYLVNRTYVRQSLSSSCRIPSCPRALTQSPSLSFFLDRLVTCLRIILGTRPCPATFPASMASGYPRAYP